jgi:hypothetical protein
MVTALCVGWQVAPAPAGPILVFDVAADFSRINNPTGVWSYGWSFNLGSPFILSTDARVREGLDTWRGNRIVDGNPGAYHNATGSPIVLGGTALFQPGQFGLHPGPFGEYALARWTAPAAGTLSLNAAFVGQDQTTTDAHVLLNNSPIFFSLIEGFGSNAAVNINLAIREGDLLDFAVGFGRNRSYSNDTTGLAATLRLNQALNPVPEPATAFLFMSGAAILLRRHWRSRPPTV